MADIRIEDINFENLTSDEARELGLNSIMLEEDGTYDWIYCMNMAKDMSMFYFVLKVVGISMLPVVIMLLFLSFGSDEFYEMLGLLAIIAGVAFLVVVICYWFVNRTYKGSYMLVYQMNEEGITFSQTTDQLALTKALAATTAAVSAAGGQIGGVISGTGLAMRPNAHFSKFQKVRSVKGRKNDNLIWVNAFFLYLQVYVPPAAYDFVWNYITMRCTNARITDG